MNTIVDAAIAVLSEPEPSIKVKLTREFSLAWKASHICNVGNAILPNQPARKSKPELLAYHEMPKRSLQSQSGRIAFIHAIAHIELNAIDLAWDLIGRFNKEKLPNTFYKDWLEVALDEAEHFDMLSKRLIDLGSTYGEYPAHNGLWEAAENTSDDLAARLAIVPMVLEARGLDTTPKAIQRLKILLPYAFEIASS